MKLTKAQERVMEKVRANEVTTVLEQRTAEALVKKGLIKLKQDHCNIPLGTCHYEVSKSLEIHGPQ